MMCSTWKFSVFGIVALMLSFGLVAGDAFAHSDGSLTHPAAPNAVNHYDDATLTAAVNSSVSTDPPNPNGNGDGAIYRPNVPLNGIPDAMKLRATEILDSIVFTYTPGVTTTIAQNIVLTIPGGWTQPAIDNNDGVNEDGEIKISQGTVSIRAGGGGWQILTGNYDPAPTTPVIITYKRVTVPKRAGAYQFAFTSNVVGAGHVSQLDAHLLTHATQVLADQGGHTHGDLGSLDFVESHTHPSATWTITLAIHTHDSDGSIAHVSPHTHTPTEDMTDAADVTVLTPIVDHAHSGAGEAVIAAHAHTHPGDMADNVPAGDHNHAGNGADVSVAVVHAHANQGEENPAIDPHTHPAAAMNENVALPHSHTAAATANAAVHPHTHETDGTIDGTTVSSHTHGGDTQGVINVLNHPHASASSEYNADTYTLGALHGHTGNNGRISAVPAHVHTYMAGANMTTADEIIGHTHDVPEMNPAVRTDASSVDDGPVHAHASAIGAVQYSGAHSHLAPGIVAGSPGHKHSPKFVATLPPLATHDHTDNTSDVPHEHTATYRAVIYPTGHSHATVDTVGGSPIHRHATAAGTGVYGDPLSPYTMPHRHTAIGSGNTPPAADSGTAPVHTHTADYARVVMAPSHTHTAALATGDDMNTGVSSGGVVHRHTLDAAGDLEVVTVHSHAADTGLSSADADNADPDLHTHTGTGMPDAVEAHQHAMEGDTGAGGTPLHQHAAFAQGATGVPLRPIDSHSHSSYSASTGEPIHAHMADYDGVAAPQTHPHASPDATAGVIPHSHSAAYLSLLTMGAHSHATEQTPAGSPLHDHVANFTVVEPIEKHQHTTLVPNDGFPEHSHDGLYSGMVRIPPSHSHSGGLTNHVAQNSPHVHTLDHNGRYVMNLGPAPSGSGSLAFRNTVSPLVKHGVEGSLYKDKYLATKGQALGDLVLTYTAAGSMVKGSGIRIITNDLPIDQFYPYNAGGPGGGVVLERGSAMFAVDPENGDADGISKNTLYVKTTASLEAGSQIGFRVRNLNLKVHGPEMEGQNPTMIVTDYTLEGSSSSPLAADGAASLANVGDAPVITVTGAHMSGEMKLSARGIAGDFTHATAGEVLNSLIFTYNTTQPMATGAMVEVELPQGWSVPFHATSQADARAGAITLAGSANLVINGMTLTATTTAELASDFAGALVFTYKAVTAPATHGPNVFITRTTAGPHGTLVELARITVDVAGTHGAGSIALTRGGSTFRQAAINQALGNLVFTYTATGRMAIDAQVQVTIPQEWTSPHPETVDGVDSPGEVSISSGNANLNVSGVGGRPWKLTATTTAALDAGGTIVFNYKSVTAPGVADSYTFETHQTSFKGALHIDNIGARLASSPTVGVGQAPDGAGTMTVAKSAAPAFSTDATGAYLANAGEALGTLTFTYTATGTMQVGASISLEIPEPWTLPVPDNGDADPTAGETVVAGAGVVGGTVVGRVITATVSTEIVSGNSFTVTYKNVNAPTAIGEYDFTAQSKSTVNGMPTSLSDGSPTIKVGTVPVGVVSISTIDAAGMSTPLVAAGPDMAIGNVTITYTATARITAGAKVIITVPAGWSAPYEDNNDGVDGAGEVEITGSASVEVTGGGVGQPRMLVATTSAVLESGDTLVFTYKNVTTPSTEKSYPFTTVASISATSTPVEIAAQQSVIVRTMVDAIAIAADDSFFAGESLSGMVTLWGGGGAAKALGDVVVMMSSDSETGSFTADSITIADNTNGAAFTYNDTAAGTVMLTATSGDGDTAMTTTKEVTVKSGVSGLDVDPTLVKAGSTITVTATGKAGGGTVKVMDSEGMQVGDTNGLDPKVEREDGDVTYSRTITLPADLADGTYTVTVDIQGLIDTMDIEVVNDQAPPTLSDANVLPRTVANGALLTLTVKATASSAINPVESVTADVSAVDSTQKDMVKLTAQPGTDNTYFAIHTISMNNTNDDGVVDVSFTATDRIGGEDTATASVTLANDASVIESVNVPSDMFRPGDTVTITATGTPGGAAFLSVLTGAHDVLVDKKAMTEDPDGTYTGSFPVVADVFPEGTYYVTVNLNTKSTSTTGLNIGPAGYTFTLSIPAGIHAIHIPLAANQVNGEDGTIETVGDVYDALGDSVRFIISLGADGNWMSYLGDESAGTTADAAIGDDTGLIAVMASAGTLELVGDALGTGGVSMVTINVGNNLVGLPLKPAAGLSMISDALVPGVGAIAVSNAAGDGFHTIQAAGDTGDGPVMGGVGYIVVATGAANIPIVGSVWENLGAVMAAPAFAFSGLQTPVLHVDGGVMDEFNMLSRIPELRVTVRNLSTGASLDTVLGTAESTTAYSATFVEFGRHAAKAGDVLEIVAHTPNPYVGVRPVPQIVVSAEEVLTSRISLPDMELYEIPSESELLANYPNPFNPETWIPYRLAQAAEVTLDIYDTNGRLVRTIDIGFKPAAVYESRASAIYWDGRNNYGERVASGTYFYHLTAGDDYASTRRMVILK